MSDVDPTEESATQADALSHAWSWFVLHSGQRMQSINFFLIAIAFILAAYGAAYAGADYIVALTISVTGIAVSYTFWMLDRRTRQLIKAAERPIAYIEREMSLRSGVPGMNLLEQVERPQRGTLTYTRSLTILMLAICFVMGVAFLAALGEVIHFPALGGTPTIPTTAP